MTRASFPLFCSVALILGLFHLPAVVADEEARSQPCSDPPYRQFDFWIGDWQVAAEDGRRLGVNRVELRESGCVLQENWISEGGAVTGTSLNYFDAKTGRWHQTWVDNQGGHLHLSGEWHGDFLRMQSVPTGENAGAAINRITWRPLDDGRVRQHWEVSKDGGVTWSDAFDGYYRRVD